MDTSNTLSHTSRCSTSNTWAKKVFPNNRTLAKRCPICSIPTTERSYPRCPCTRAKKMLVKGVAIMVAKTKVRLSLVVLREFLKESEAQLGHLDQRDLQDLLDLQVMDSLDLWDDPDLQVHQEGLEWETQVYQDWQASQEEMVRMDHKEKWALGVKKGQLGSQGHRVPQDHLGYQE
ncbi:hypothetical protein PFLUV_G00147070 [Perca fluviatilis]|uniref:Uncharacterized protein n=1 Tax=Perca fluviatilis TaxID=8168 RepID=A0A6A5E272_PERFL|nr:hypothetical protein PFLUV_G00147070 [Perca fluviatilis]